MKYLVNNTRQLNGIVNVPGNKSGTARGIILGSLAEGVSRVKNPLLNIDSFSIIDMFRKLGAKIDTSNDKEWVIEGTGGDLEVPAGVLDAGNSGTGYYMVTAVTSLLKGKAVISGDYQICYRPAGPLVDALNNLGAKCISTRDNGLAPLFVEGGLTGGKTSMTGINSQWMTPILIAGSLAPQNSEIEITTPMSEKPYINMTMGMMEAAGVHVEHDDYQKYHVTGNQKYKATDFVIPGDWGTSGYPMMATAITDSKVTFNNLYTGDYAGETQFIDVLKRMGADVEVIDEGRGGITVTGGKELKGIEIDCSGTPDAVPVLAVLGCYAQGKTVLKNVGASRLKETDRTAIIKKELEKMGAKLEETEDTLTIYHSDLHGAFIDGHHDHRIVMATSVAALIADGPSIIDNAEYSAVSYPSFFEDMKAIGADIQKMEIVD